MQKDKADSTSLAEPSIGFICSCLPSLTLLIRHIRRRQPCSTTFRRTAKDLDLEQVNPPTKSLNFTTELAMWSDTAPEEQHTIMSGTTCAANASQDRRDCDAVSLDSKDGRREGWLADREHQDENFVERELALVSRNEPWDHIWDGGEKPKP